MGGLGTFHFKQDYEGHSNTALKKIYWLLKSVYLC